jgi:predicted dehydrogenase
MDQIRVGMVGVSHFGKYRRDRMKETGLFKVVACYDYSAEAAAQCAAEESCDIAETYDALIARDDIEAVVVSTGADSHADYAIRAANAGKHIFVEKPLCTSTQELEALLGAGEKNGVVMGMGHGAPDGAVNALIRDYLANDKIGTLTAIEMTTCHGGGWCASPWRFIPEKNPGGMLFQCGVHMIYWFEAMFGRITEVACMMRYDVNPNTKTSDATTVLLRAESGLLATLTAYHVTAYRHTKSLFGTNGNIYINETPEEVFYQARSTEGKPEPVETVDLSTVHAGPMAGNTNVITWAKAIRGDGTPTPSIYDGASAVAVIFAAEESSRTGRIVAVPDVRARVAAG